MLHVRGAGGDVNQIQLVLFEVTDHDRRAVLENFVVHAGNLATNGVGARRVVAAVCQKDGPHDDLQLLRILFADSRSRCIEHAFAKRILDDGHVCCREVRLAEGRGLLNDAQRCDRVTAPFDTSSYIGCGVQWVRRVLLPLAEFDAPLASRGDSFCTRSRGATARLDWGRERFKERCAVVVRTC